MGRKCKKKSGFISFFRRAGVSGGVLIVEWEMSGLFLLPNTCWTQFKETSHCNVAFKFTGIIVNHFAPNVTRK